MKSSYTTKILWALLLLLQLNVAMAAESIDQLRASGARITVDSRTAVARFVGFDADKVAQQPPGPLQSISAQAAAAQHLNNYAALFGLQNATSETSAIKHRDSADGRSMTRFQQKYQGIPVIAGELLVNQTALHQLSSISGRVSPKINLDTTPVKTSEEAVATALGGMLKWYRLPADQFDVSAPTLSIYDSRLMTPFADPIALVWQMEIKARAILPIREFVLVNANTGAVVLHFNQVPHAKNRLTYDANNTTAMPGTLVCNEANPTCTGGSTDAVFAHRYAGTTYDFYSTILGRDGINGTGMTMISSVKICPAGYACPYANAFWNGTQMAYGQGYAVSEDVVGHELTHGVTENESGLNYYYQSGAINESFSDVFGELIQQSNISEPISPANRWLMGEQLSIGAIRSMKDPTLYSDPDKMTSPFYNATTSDSGGVHTNSGVNNKAAYLMVDGGSFNGKTVAALGLTKTVKIYYRVQTNLLTSGSDYLDLHNALYQACQDLIGTSGINSSDCLAVQNATLAVEMHLEPSAGFMPSAAFCPAGQSVGSVVFGDGFESNTANWTLSHASGTVDWARVNYYATSGLYSLFGADNTVSSDLTATMASNIVATANTHLWFNHAFDFEPEYDGGVLEYSTNGGSTWSDASALYAEGQNYSGVLVADNVLAGRSAFTSVSHGYVSSRYSLSTLAGQSVRFRWRSVSDSSAARDGWYVDDVRIHTCSAAATPPGPPTNVSVAGYPGRVQVSFTAPVNTGSGPITGYTVSCSAGGQVTRTNTGSASPINVYGLTAGVVYSCSVTASNSGATSTASTSATVTGPLGLDLTPILFMLND